ncbi:MAG: hypothetical protein M0C28_14870 [Candidatus Moduliflexus flocculans]|nr:hypothetical protein [Candidatus Moduliflexus flocculans]
MRRRGSSSGRSSRTKTVEPFYAFRVETDEAAPTGNWRARVLVGGMTFEKTLKVETVAPNRLKIVLDAGRETLVRKDMPFDAAVAAQWLHGAPASNLKFDVSVRLTPAGDEVRPLQGLCLRRPGPRVRGRDARSGQGRSRRRRPGRAPRSTSTRSSPSPGMLDAAFTSRVFEESGDFSVDTFSLPFHPYDSYVGVRAPQGRPGPGPARDRQGPCGRRRHRRSRGPARFAGQGRRVPLPDRVEVVVGQERRVARPVRRRRPEPARLPGPRSRPRTAPAGGRSGSDIPAGDATSSGSRTP